MGELPEYIDGLPNICGSEPLIAETVRAARERPVFFGDQVADPLAGIEAAFAIALHMHQPLIPAGGDDVRSARLISNLQYMSSTPTSATTTTLRCSAGATSAWASSFPSSSRRAASRG